MNIVELPGSIKLAALLAAGAVLVAAPAQADQNLHVFCVPLTPCASVSYGGNDVVQTTTSTPQFGFRYSGGTITGNYYIDILVPISEDPNPSALHFKLTETDGGSDDTQTVTATSTLITSPSPTWSSGFLTDYLNRNTSPKNPLDAWLGLTQKEESNASETGYYVYDVSFGNTLLNQQGSGPDVPVLTFDVGGGYSSLSLGAVVVGFLSYIVETTKKGVTTDNTEWVSTAQSEALMYGQELPEPATLFLVFGGLLGLGFFYRPARAKLA